MCNLNLSKYAKTEEIKMNVCFLQAYFPDANKFIQELVNDSKKNAKCMQD